MTSLSTRRTASDDGTVRMCPNMTLTRDVSATQIPARLARLPPPGAPSGNYLGWRFRNSIQTKISAAEIGYFFSGMPVFDSRDLARCQHTGRLQKTAPCACGVSRTLRRLGGGGRGRRGGRRGGRAFKKVVHSHSHPLSHAHSVSLTHSLSHTLSLTHTFVFTRTLSLTHTHSFSHTLSLSHTHTLRGGRRGGRAIKKVFSRSLLIEGPREGPRSLSLSLFLSLSLSLSLFLSLWLSLSISLSLPVSLSRAVPRGYFLWARGSCRNRWSFDRMS